MQEKNTSKYQDVMNSFSMCVLTNDGFEKHAEFSKEHGHPDSMRKEQLKIYHNTLNDLREKHSEIYKRLYNKLFALILEDNIRGKASAYSTFDKVRDFGEYIKMTQEKKDSLEQVCIKYESREWWLSTIV